MCLSVYVRDRVCQADYRVKVRGWHSGTDLTVCACLCMAELMFQAGPKSSGLHSQTFLLIFWCYRLKACKLRRIVKKESVKESVSAQCLSAEKV